MIKTNSISSDEARITPLSFVTPPAAPRQSFALRLRGSSYLFPKTSSSPRMMSADDSNSNDNDHASEGPIKNSYYDIKEVDDKKNIIVDDKTSENFNPKTKEEVENKNKAKKQNELSKQCISNAEQRPKKKSVTFDDEVDSYQLGIPCASDMSSKEKQIMWYSANEFDQFKYEAAKHAGVKIVRYDSEKMGQSHHFAMMGDFDFKTNEENATRASNKNDIIANRSYHNENEYNDRCNSNGEAICKRGLGFHFSRNRKKSRAATRSAVMAWQKTLNDPDNQSDPKFQESLPSLGGDPGKNSGENSGKKAGKLDKTRTSGNADKTRAMLALVSAKCSRVARMEAKWRGDVDCRVAYPERNAPATTAESSSSSANVGNRSEDSANVATGKRSNVKSRDGDGILSRPVLGGGALPAPIAKRRRIGGGGCRGDGVSSFTPVGCISGGMLQAEV